MLNAIQRDAAEDGNDSPSVPAEKRKRGRAKKEADAGDGDEPATKKAKAATKKGKKVKVEDDSEGDAQPKQSRRKTAKAKLEDEPSPTIKVDDNDDDKMATPSTKKQRGPHKATLKKIKSEDVDPENGEPKCQAIGGDEAREAGIEDFADEAENTESSKPKKSRKPAIKRKTKGTRADSKPTAKTKQKVFPHIHLHETVANKSP